MSRTALAYASLVSISEALDKGSLSSIELCQLLLDKIGINANLHAFSDVLTQQAQAEAYAADKRRKYKQSLGPLDGVPIAIKDLIDTSPAICQAGLDHLRDYRAYKDAAIVKKLRQAGAVILGVTETDSGAFNTQTLQTTNPIAPDRIVGGSSGGSGAAVAAGLAFAAIGTDTGGSIRIPAACCSIAGFKPTWGRADMTGIRPLAASCDHVGPLARSVADLRLVQSILDNQVDTTLAIEPEQLRMGIAEQYYQDADPEIQRALEHIITQLKQQPVNLHPIDLPSPDSVMPYHMINVCCEAADYHQQNFAMQWQHYPTVAREAIAIGGAVTAEQRSLANEQRNNARVQLDAVFDDVDVIILPTLPMDAPLRESESLVIGGNAMPVLNATVRYTALFNQTGHPVVSVPAYPLADGRAISMQLVGAQGNDNDLLAIAEWFEQQLAVTIDHEHLVESE